MDANGVSESTTVYEDIYAQIDPDSEDSEYVRYDIAQRMYLS